MLGKARRGDVGETSVMVATLAKDRLPPLRPGYDFGYGPVLSARRSTDAAPEARVVARAQVLPTTAVRQTDGGGYIRVALPGGKTADLLPPVRSQPVPGFVPAARATMPALPVTPVTGSAPRGAVDSGPLRIMGSDRSGDTITSTITSSGTTAATPGGESSSDAMAADAMSPPSSPGMPITRADADQVSQGSAQPPTQSAPAAGGGASGGYGWLALGAAVFVGGLFLASRMKSARLGGFEGTPAEHSARFNVLLARAESYDTDDDLRPLSRKMIRGTLIRADQEAEWFHRTPEQIDRFKRLERKI